MAGFDTCDAWKTASPYDEYSEFDQERLEKAVRELSEGRNAACFGVLSFGGKDADLDSGGCTGIVSLRTQDGSSVDRAFVRVGGHKTLCPGEEWNEGQLDLAQELVCGCGCGGEWGGDSWGLCFEDEIVVGASADDLDEDGDYDYAKIAARIVGEARRACEEFSNEMGYLEKSFEDIEKGVDS